tara:strand:+ start:1159 stop:1338 length:180 start_codon:yes stop_codon:yes gene_type:complete
MGLVEYAAIAVIVYIVMTLLLKFGIIAMYLYGMYQFMKEDSTPTKSLVNSDQFNPDLDY